MSSDLSDSAPSPGLPRCPRCGDIVGVYEPSMLVTERRPEPVWTAADPPGAGRVSATYHRACYEVFATSRA